MFAAIPGHTDNILKVGASVIVGRGSDSAEDHFAIFECFRDVCRKFNTVLFHIPVYHILKTRLINRNDPIFKVFDFFLINVHTGNIDTNFCKAGACD